MSNKLLNDEELDREIRIWFHDQYEGNVDETTSLIDLINSQKRLYAESEKLGLIDKLNKEMFYSEANPSGQHIKNCLMAEYDALQPMPPSQLEQIAYGKWRRAEQKARINL